MATHEPLTCQRDLFSLPAGHCWLNSAYMGPLPKPVEQAGVAALAARAATVGITPADFFEPAERTRALCAQLVDADPESVAFVPTASCAMAVVAKNLHPGPGSNVVMPGDLFPSSVYAWRNWRERGVAMRMVPAPIDTAAMPAGSAQTVSRAARWNRALLDAIDEHTALVSVEPAHWTDGTLFDLDAIGQRCRAVGAAFVIDATQCAGAMPLSARALQADALVVHSYKSMLSNYGLGFTVFGERFRDGSPIEESWLMRAESDNFARLLDYEERYAGGMRRYDSSLRANPVLIGMLEAACKLLLEWQPARIRDYLYQIERTAVERLRALGLQVADEAERAANLFGIVLPAGVDPEACRKQLAAQQIHVSVRGSAVRVSPHVYNDAVDLQRLVDALAVIVAPGEH